jgi:hypothetical protein
MHEDRIAALNERIDDIKLSLVAPYVRLAASEIPALTPEISGLQETLDEIRAALKTVPAIEVAFLGPSRHGKSTMLNALARATVLPMSDVKPCTASIVSMRASEDWSIRVKFIGRDELLSDWKEAVQDAEEYLQRLRNRDLEGEEPDDPRYFQSSLQRFIQLFKIDPEQSPEALIKAVKKASIPTETAKFLGRIAHPNATELESMRVAVEGYLSTKDVYWTIVESCNIEGPFQDWHPNLQVLDLPGTNDTNPHRTAITNGLREKAQAVAIVVGESNLGVDIQSWLRQSTVLSEFLEAREESRQRLFIVRTRFDSYHPEIEHDDSLPPDDEAEERLYQEAIARHKTEQTESYHEMLRDIAAPLLPLGSTEEERTKREELIRRLENIPVFFVSALAHEAFEGRWKTTRRNKQHFSEQFNDDPAQTGIPELRDYLNRVAEEYLAQNYYDDLENRLEKEVDRVVRYFRRERRTLEAQLAGAGDSVRALVENVQDNVVPWIREEVGLRTSEFHAEAVRGVEEVRAKLNHVFQMSERRLRDKTDKWVLYAWNSLKATARKGGSHTTCRGNHIDINQDICSVLVDDLILAWSCYRDYLIQKRIDDVTDNFAVQLQQRLLQAAGQINDPDAQAAIQEIIQHLQSLAHSQRLELLQQVDEKVKELESIRQPAYAFVQQTMQKTYRLVAVEHGTGCQARMRKILIDGFDQNLPRIQEYIRNLVEGAAGDLAGHCGTALTTFQTSATEKISRSLHEVHEIAKIRDRDVIEGRIEVVNNAVDSLPGPAAA